MGTQAITIFVDEENAEVARMYRQMDGYPAGHGKELAEFLTGFRMVNGFSMNDWCDPKVANGMDCLAAQVVCHFKAKVNASRAEYERLRRKKKKVKVTVGQVGSIYLQATGGPKDHEWIYEVSSLEGKPWLTVRLGWLNGAVIWAGHPGGFDPKAVDASAAAEYAKAEAKV